MGGTAEVKRWWDEFGRIRDLDGKIAAVLRVCALNREEEFYKELDIGSAILDCIQEDFIRKRDREGYCRFLESLRRNFPKVFNLNSGYHAEFLIRWYAFTTQAERLVDIINHLVEFPREEPDILIDLMDVLILNGFTEEAWKLIRSHYPVIRGGDETVPEGKHEIALLAGIFIIAKHAEEGAFDTERLKKDLDEFDLMPQNEERYMGRLEIMFSKGYECREWPKGALRGNKAWKNLPVLTGEFVRFLRERKGMNSVCAQLLESYILEYFLRTRPKPLFTFSKSATDEYLAELCSPFSLSRTKAFIVLCDHILFYEFIHERKIIDEKTHTEAIEGLAALKGSMLNVFKNQLWEYAFVTKLPLGADLFPRELFMRFAHEEPLAYLPGARKVGRNEPCPCGSGRKYKKCCLLKERGTA